MVVKKKFLRQQKKKNCPRTKKNQNKKKHSKHSTFKKNFLKKISQRKKNWHVRFLRSYCGLHVKKGSKNLKTNSLKIPFAQHKISLTKVFHQQIPLKIARKIEFYTKKFLQKNFSAKK